MTDIKSQNDLNQPETHSTEVLLSTIEELEKVKKQLEIAVEALDLYKNFRYDGTLKGYESIAREALEQIKELEK